MQDLCFIALQVGDNIMKAISVWLIFTFLESTCKHKPKEEYKTEIEIVSDHKHNSSVTHQQLVPI